VSRAKELIESLGECLQPTKLAWDEAERRVASYLGEPELAASSVAELRSLARLAALDEPSAFVTGSRAYGIPSEDSDLDVVVLVSEEVAAALTVLAANSGGKVPSVAGSIRLGDLNLIMVTTDEALDVWRKGTDELRSRAPVERSEAVTLFTQLREQAGL